MSGPDLGGVALWSETKRRTLAAGLREHQVATRRRNILSIVCWLAAALSLSLVADKFDKEAVCSR
jgi:hypothetical protein